MVASVEYRDEGKTYVNLGLPDGMYYAMYSWIWFEFLAAYHIAKKNP